MNEPQSTISRLESKYSDILDRVAKRKQRQQEREAEDRDKTLEPEYPQSRSTGLMKSQTTANIMSKQKERTPYRVERNKNKYSTNSDSDESAMKLKRSDMIGVGSSYLSSGDSYTKMKSNDSGYHDSYKTHGKSMYDPEALMSDHMTRSNKKTPQPQASSTATASTRQIRPYRRTESGMTEKRRTGTNLHELLSDEESEFENRSNQRKHQLYTQRKSSGLQLRSMEDRNGHNYQPPSETSDSLSGSDFEDFDKKERENRRKEIQSLIKKYAQMDDFYGRSTAYSNNADIEPIDTNNNNSERNKGNSSKNESSSKIDPWDVKNKISPIRIPQKKSLNPLGKSQTMANVPSMSSSQYNDNNGHSSWYMSNYHSNNVVPIKTNVARSSTKSRMSKALSTFVRIFALFNSSVPSYARFCSAKFVLECFCHIYFANIINVRRRERESTKFFYFEN